MKTCSFRSLVTFSLRLRFRCSRPFSEPARARSRSRSSRTWGNTVHEVLGMLVSFFYLFPLCQSIFFVHVSDSFVDASSVLTLGDYSILTGQSTTRRYANSNSEASQLHRNAHSQSSWSQEHAHNQSKYNIHFGCWAWCSWCHTLCGK